MGIQPPAGQPRADRQWRRGMSGIQLELALERRVGIASEPPLPLAAVDEAVGIGPEQ
jgi:hypothetical protein